MRNIFKKSAFLLIIVILFDSCDSNEQQIDEGKTDIPMVVLPHLNQSSTTNWKIVEELSDEFNDPGIDLNKWNNFYPDWNGRLPSWFVRNNVSVSLGELNITMKKEILPEMDEGYEYSTGIVRSKNSFLYGFSEIRAKCMNSAGSSAFFLNNVQADWWTEIDVFEIGGNSPGFEFIVNTNVHEFYNPLNVIEPYVIREETHYSSTRAFEQSWKPSQDYHIYGIEWGPQKIRWYLDGDLLREEENDKWHQELYINIDSEIIIEWFGLPNDSDLPSIFSIDYVRTWKGQ